MTPIQTFLFSELITYLFETITYVSDDRKVKPEIWTILFIPQCRRVTNKAHLGKTTNLVSCVCLRPELLLPTPSSPSLSIYHHSHFHHFGPTLTMFLLFAGEGKRKGRVMLRQEQWVTGHLAVGASVSVMGILHTGAGLATKPWKWVSSSPFSNKGMEA